MTRILTGAPDKTRWRRMTAFVMVLSALQLGWQGLRGSPIEQFVIHDATVRPATLLVNSLTPDVHAEPIGSSLHAPGGGLNIINGCEGMEALFLLTAAFVVARMPWRWRWTGFLLGVAVVFIVNQARILVLFYACRKDPALFDTLHATVTPIAVVLLVIWYLYIWLIYASRHGQPPPGTVERAAHPP